MLEPWQVLLDLGHFSSYNYNYLLKILEDFKDINEKTMARTLLNLSINHTGIDDLTTRIIQNTYEANKKGDSTILRKDLADKKNQLTWSIDNLVRAFRELYTHLNW
jgi:Holliday junction resolvasome RuvABC ATP-dependent DNA helicase subunit